MVQFTLPKGSSPKKGKTWPAPVAANGRKPRGTKEFRVYRYDPDRVARGENPLQLDSAAPKKSVADYFQLENRFKMLNYVNPTAAAEMLARAELDASTRREFYEFLATRKFIVTQPYL